MKRVINISLSILVLCLIVTAFSWVIYRQEQQLQAFAEQEQKQVLTQQKLALLEQKLAQVEREQGQALADLELKNQLQEEAQTQEILEKLQVQQETIVQLQSALERLVQASQDRLGAGGDFVMKCSAETFDYLAIGNSITTHDACDYWPNTSGMAASTPEKDYFHLVSAGLEATKGKVNSYAFSLFAWEVIATDRGEMATLTDRYLTEDLDLITIQLGENAQDLSTFQDDYVYLIQHIRQLAPNAKILILGDFWSYEDRNLLKMQAAQQCGAIFVSLDAIMDDPTYQAGEKIEVTDQFGQIHEIRHGGVAKHPSDEAMAYIAQAILSAQN